MPIDIVCPACQGRFRVPDTAAGKRIKCPKCKGIIGVPAPQADEPAATGPADTWTLKIEEGDEFGPVPREQLDQWFREGRITADCQVLLTGAPQWQWATDLFPELEMPPAAEASASSQDAFPAFGEAPAAQSGFPVASEGSSIGRARSSTSKKGKGRSSSRSGTSAGDGEVSDKSKVTALLLCLFLGNWGAHHFYIGDTKRGVIHLCLCGGCWVLTIIDLVAIVQNKFLDTRGRRLKE